MVFRTMYFFSNHVGIRISNPTLQTRRGSGLSKRECTPLLSELASALSYLHSVDVLHGNVRPENVRIDLSGHVRLAGFNYAQSK